MQKTINIRVLPRSSCNEVAGKMSNGTLKVKLTTPPINGEANKALLKLLAKHFNIPKSKIKIAKGLTNKNKIIQIE